MNNIKIKFLYVALFLISFYLQGMSETIKWPEKYTKFDGWMGIKFINDKNCDDCVSLLFPKNFGLNNSLELKVLIELTHQLTKDDIEYDIEKTIYFEKDVMDHLLNLAISKKYAKAAELVLYPEKNKLDLGVELSELHTQDYVIPLLMNYHNLDEIIAKDNYKTFAKEIAWMSAVNADFRLANKLINKLAKYSDFTNLIKKECEKEKELMKKHGQNFLE